MISKSVVISTAMYGLNALLGLATSVVFARLLGPHEFGIFSYYLSVAILIAVPVQAGMPTLLIREMAQAKANGDWGKVLGSARRAMEFVSCFSLPVLLAGIFFASKVAEPRILLLSLVLVPLMAFGAVRGAAIRSLGLVNIGQAPEMVIKPIMILLLVVGVLSLRSRLYAQDAMLINVISAGVAFLIGSALLRRVLRSLQPAQAILPSPQSWASWLGALAPFALLSGFHVLNRQVGVVVLGRLGQPADIAIYRVASQFADTLNLILLAVTAVVAPRVAALYARGDLVQLQKIVTRAALEIALITVPAVLFLALFGDSLIRAVFGESYAGAFPLLLVLAMGQVVSVVSGPVGLVLNMAHRQTWVTAMIGMGALTNLLTCVVLAKQLGAMAAALGAAISMAFINISLYVVVKRTLSIDTSVLRGGGRHA